MQNKIDLVALLNLLGASQSFLLALAVLGLRRGNRGARLSLAALLATLSVLIAGSIISHTKYVLVWPHLAQVHIPFQFLVAPLLFLYLKNIAQPQANSGRKALLHLVPFALCLLYLLPFYLQTSEQKAEFVAQVFQQFPLGWYVRMGLVLVQALVYLYLCARLIVGRSRENQGDSVASSNLLWLRIVLGSFVMIWAAAAIRYLFAFRVETNLIIPLLLSAFTYLIFFVGIRRPEVLAGAEALSRSQKYENSSLTSERAGRYLVKLKEVMERERPYLDSELTLIKLSKKLAISPHQLSQVINHNLGQNFLEFVNAYRVEEVKRRLTDPRKKHYSIIAAAQEAGFNSKSTFNTVFKKHTNMTPSEFRRSNSAEG